jgi:membrane fusion protein (multidrug efflux system)
VLLVGADNKVEVRKIKTSDAVGDQWIVTSGLQGGEKVIVDGLQKAKPGAEVKPVPFAGAKAAASPAAQ